MSALLVGLLTGGLFAAVSTPVHARPHRAPVTLIASLAPPVVTTGEPAAVATRISPARAGRSVTVEVLTDGKWIDVGYATSDAAGRALIPLDTTDPGPQVLRAVSGKLMSSHVSLTVRGAADCKPSTPLVDRLATSEARCLAARLDRWRSAGLMGVGQELNMSAWSYDAPLTSLGGRRVSVVGFDLWELGKTATYQPPFFDRAFADLVAQARAGAVLTASWHAPNPHNGLEYNNRDWHDLGALLRDTPEADAFWTQYDEQLAVLKALQDVGVAVVFRPLHEANGKWFWWGGATPSVYKQVYSQMQQRAWSAGVHNIVWAYSFNAKTDKTVADPVSLLPAKVDLAGIDSYWPATGSHRSQAPSMDGYSAVAKKVRRMAFTEIGPYADHGTWKPSVITSTAREQARRPVWALLWVDDAAGRKQISSLSGGVSWLDSCPFGYCAL